MKLLVVAQALDADHPVLGFFVRWVGELAKRVEAVAVVASAVGAHRLPANVSVYSLGKESGVSRLRRYARYVSYVIRLRDRYDTVFVHMVPEFAVLAGPLWRLMGKRVALWYNHDVASPWLPLAALFSRRMFYTSPYAVTTRFGKARRMSAGVDTDLFKPDPSVAKIPKSVYVQGRIAPSKKVHVLLEAFAMLRARGIANLLTLVGPADEAYLAPLKERYRHLVREGSLVFAGPKRNDETPALYRSHAVSVNLAAAGHYDKSVLESIACGTPALVASPAFDDLLPPEYRIASLDPKDVARALERALTDPAFPPTPRDQIVKKHSLSILADALTEAL